MAIKEASKFVDENLGIRLYEYDKYKIICEFKKFNKQCIGVECPFYKFLV